MQHFDHHSGDCRAVDIAPGRVIVNVSHCLSLCLSMALSLSLHLAVRLTLTASCRRSSLLASQTNLIKASDLNDVSQRLLNDLISLLMIMPRPGSLKQISLLKTIHRRCVPSYHVP